MTLLLFIIPLAAILTITILFWSYFSTTARYTFGILWVVGAAIVWFTTGSFYFLCIVNAVIAVFMLLYLKIMHGFNI